jgi:hypothetical protein
MNDNEYYNQDIGYAGHKNMKSLGRAPSFKDDCDP